MVLQMGTVDLGQWLVLTILGVILPFVAALYLIFGSVQETLLEGDCADMDTTLGQLALNIWAMLNVLIAGGGDAYVGCLQETSNAGAASSLFLLFLLVTVVLLLNLLIAQFGNTFNNISEKAPTNFQFGFGRIVINAEKLSLLPAPFSLLRVLHVLVLAGRFLCGKCIPCERKCIPCDRAYLPLTNTTRKNEGDAAPTTSERHFDLDLSHEKGYEIRGKPKRVMSRVGMDDVVEEYEK
eukprot:6043093-Prymnesium_polylepis.1